MAHQAWIVTPLKDFSSVKFKEKLTTDHLKPSTTAKNKRLWKLVPS